MAQRAEQFKQWMIVEILGRQRIAGLVTEEVIAGQGFLRVDVPKTATNEAFTKYIGTSSIHSMTPVDEKTAHLAAESYRVRPIETWQLSRALQLQLTASQPESDDDEDFDLYRETMDEEPWRYSDDT